MSSTDAPTEHQDEEERLSLLDSYVCTEPAGDLPLLMRNGPDEYTGLLRTLQRSAEYFSERDQKRVLERIYFEQALLHMKHQNWKHAMRILLPLWQKLAWRRAGWWILLREVDHALEECARHVKDVDTLIAVQWELLHGSLTSAQEHDHAFTEAVRDVPENISRPTPTLRTENIVSPVSATLAFDSSEAHVGLPLPYQLVLTSHARPGTRPLDIERIEIFFEGTLRRVKLHHKADDQTATLRDGGGISMQNIDLEELDSGSYQDVCLIGNADLCLTSGCVKVIGLDDIPRDSGDVTASKITIILKERDFDIELVTSEADQLHQGNLFQQDGDRVVERPLRRDQSNKIHVLPKPPKLRLTLSTIDRDLFVDESRTLSLNVMNDEDEEVEVLLQLQFPDEGERGVSIAWETSQSPAEVADSLNVEVEKKQKSAGRIPPSASQTHAIVLNTGSQVSEHIVQIKATYFLRSDSKTQIFVPLERELKVHRPFECTHRFAPLLHSDPWPRYFELQESEPNGRNGLTHRYLLTSQLMSVANLGLSIEDVEVEVLEVHEAAHCGVKANAQGETKTLAPGEVRELQFTLDIQKDDIEDRRPTYVDLRLKVTWHPEMSGQSPMIAYYVVPELAIPFGEPRIFATAESASSPAGTTQLTYTIENPSIYSLQFNVMMETSEEFAFSGSKNITLQLLPLSRQMVMYSILPLARGTWISPQLRVYDVMFHKQLKIQGDEGVRNDKKGGISVWIDAPD